MLRLALKQEEQELPATDGVDSQPNKMQKIMFLALIDA
jgi:hypothetical protein